MFEIDEISNLLKVDTDLTIAEIEKRLGPLGYTLGYFCPPENKVPLEEALGGNYSNVYHLQYGSIKDLCVALYLEARDGEVIQTKVVPRQATGPRWKNLILGTGRRTGILYQAVMKIFPRPSSLAYSMIPFSREEESYEWEREMGGKEMIPRAFGRYSKSRLSPILKLSSGTFFLLMEWTGGDVFVKSLLHEWSHWLRKKKVHSHIVDEADQKLKLMRLLKRHPPERPWGGVMKAEKDPEVLKWERKLIEAIQ